ncbi:MULTISPECIES: YaeQ family protein [Aliivibrio]|uniref:YaeQ family protein n=1 Tax=Aliivibrio finisterrensis TaxID=511998 RepID=A0A4Q5KQM8_9GAMM|nr:MULTISPECIES: YaeQ family protein [Aliivibrio]MDD9180364.1 YaeQ family protein [Aliivibrio sp. A6]RYU48979.1 YaeQ family protein [Aliivibrio finisterrensis]RYU49259.1 YaeQ family protein [Aliivibrio finisterrensis]RYU54550.1 YaeQ family protein [Aliivibrio finisterrensis]RYU61209.1 YaeQ family protein [Aliivibrio finisterrensis]
MAIKPTIYKFRVALTDMNRDHYDSVNLTIAQHPSENVERMMARVLAFCLNAEENLTFTKGLSAVDEPDIWVREYDDTISLWIDAGEPDPDRMKKASRQSKVTKVYSFNSKSDVWWKQNQSKFKQYPVEVVRFDWEQIQEFSTFLERTMEFSVMITGDSAFISTVKGESEVTWETLQSVE